MLSIEISETQDLNSPNGKPKLLFYHYSCQFFFLQSVAEGNCEVVIEYKKEEPKKAV